MSLFSKKFLVTGCLALVLVITISYSSTHYSNASINNADQSLSFSDFSSLTEVNSNSDANAIISEGPLTPSEFINQGGKSVIIISPNSQVINASRGSTIKVTLTLTHVVGINPLSNVTVVANGIANGYIPSYVMKSTTPQEREDAIRNTGKPIAGSLELNSLATFPDKQITLKPNETKSTDLYITIPQNWPDDIVGDKIWFSIVFGEGGNYSYHDLLIRQTGISIQIVN